MYNEMAKRADPAKVEMLAGILLRIYEASRTKNNGAVMGEAVLCGYFEAAAENALLASGVLDPNPLQAELIGLGILDGHMLEAALIATDVLARPA